MKIGGGTRGRDARGRARVAVAIVALGALGAIAAAGCGHPSAPGAAVEALVVVSPHPDDESILAAGTISRLAADPTRIVRAVYVSAGDRATVPGDCNGIPEGRKTELIVELREGETRAAWRVLAPGRAVPIMFVRGPDRGLVRASRLVAGERKDELTVTGEEALERAATAAMDLPDRVRSVILVTTSIYDAHPDHRVAYRAARRAAGALRRDRGLDVRLWSWIVHDEIRLADPPLCCAGDTHWPAPGPTTTYEALVDTPERPRPPGWDRLETVPAASTVRSDAIGAHVSQVIGRPSLCMPVYLPGFYERWAEKIEEPFYEERP